MCTHRGVYPSLACRVLAKCSSVLGKGGPEDSPVVPLDRAFELSYRASYEELAGRGERVLACAMLPLDGAEYPADFDFDDANFPQEGVYAGNDGAGGGAGGDGGEFFWGFGGGATYWHAIASRRTPPLRRERESKEGVSGGSDRELPPLPRVSAGVRRRCWWRS